MRSFIFECARRFNGFAKGAATLTPPRHKVLQAAFVGAVLGTPVVIGFLTNEKTGTAFAQEQEPYLPISRTAPMWPQEALVEDLQGRVVIEFVVTKAGTVRDLKVVESTDPKLNEPALRATETFRYHPRTQGGRAVDVHGARVTYGWTLNLPAVHAEYDALCSADGSACD